MVTVTRILWFYVLFLFGYPLKAQQIVRISREEAEAIFLQNNLHLISGKLQIEAQKAEVIQARLWPNPVFSVGEVNLWATSRQTGGQEVSPPFWNQFGRNQQVTVEITQLIQTAGKRKKLVDLEHIGVAQAEQYFEDLLRGLKLELRHILTELQYVQQWKEVHQYLIEKILLLTRAYKSQRNRGHISKAEYTRLRAQALEMEKEMMELDQRLNILQMELKLLLRLDPLVLVEVTNEGYIRDPAPWENLSLTRILEEAKKNRPDYKRALLQEEYARKLWNYERSLRIPDVNFGIHYDRNSSTMLDFVGFGVSFELPALHRNQGNILKAKRKADQAKTLREHQSLAVENEILLSYQSLHQAIAFLEKIEPDYEDDLDELLESYTQNFASRHVSMLRYLDFMDAYQSNKKIILEARKDVHKKAEEFNYFVGKDVL